jgi:hypothetical protein
MDQTRGDNTMSGRSDAGQECPSGISLEDVGRQVKDKAGTLVREAREQGSKVLDEVGEQAQSFFEQGKTQVAEQVKAVAETLRNSCGDGRDAGAIGRYAKQAGEHLVGLADAIRESNPRDLGRKAEGFARQRPEVFLGGALVTGVLIGRFLRSHEPEGGRVSDQNLGNMMPERERRSCPDPPNPGSDGAPGSGTATSGLPSTYGAGPGIGAAATGLGATSFSEADEDLGGAACDTEGGV